jgi:nicotinate phosphoribosyltransferase
VHGIQNAIKVGEMLRQQQRPLLAIRLDSGDLLELSKKARKMLDQAGFKDTQTIASGDLTVEKIAYLKSKRAPIDAWGVGTKLVTAYEQPALDMIYKLTAIANAKNQFIYKMKLSDSPSKMTYPGILQVRRFYQKQIPVQDVVYMQDTSIKNTKESKDLLVPIFRKGKLVYKSPALADIRAHCLQQVNAFAQAKKSYPVIIDSQLQDMIREIQLQL